MIHSHYSFLVPDIPVEIAQPNLAQQEAQRLTLLNKRRRQCKVFLLLVAKCISENHYLKIICHTTSLNWVFKLIKRDYDLKVTGIDFLNLADIKYKPNTMTLAAYFEKVKAHIRANTA